jgi:serine/threonine protein kinase, bacterial
MWPDHRRRGVTCTVTADHEGWAEIRGLTMAGTRLGTQFGPYELQSLLGHGGMGEVYRAYDIRRERVVALKLLRPDLAADPRYRARFQRESRIAARLLEPHVIPVHDFGEIEGVLFIDMRLVEGPSLRDVLQANGALASQRTVSIVGQVAKALDAAHASGLAHRDVKPENVLMTADAFAYLVDFGIANGGGEASVTKADVIMGSCAYIAPERLSGRPGDPVSDVYSLTCLLYECLTGRAPFEGADAQHVMRAHMSAPPPRPSLARSDVSPAFDAVIATGMAKNPAQRYGSVGALAKAATSALGAPFRPSGPTSTRQYSAPLAPPPAHVPKPAARVERSGFSRGQVALLATTLVLFGLAALLAIVLVLTGGGGWDATQAPPITPVTTAPSVEVASSTQAPTPTPSPTFDRPGGHGPPGYRPCHRRRCDGS